MARIKVILNQLTHGDYGHFLNHRQALSNCGRFLYYDTRNADPDIAKTTRIESLDLIDGTVRVIYDTKSNSEYGPGVGAVVCHPRCSMVLFIHGLTNCDQRQPYSVSRRFGAWARFDPVSPQCRIASLESRSLNPRLSWGVLGGGTHAHSFSADGKWVSFTYNDAHRPDRRTVGFAYVDHWDALLSQQQAIHLSGDPESKVPGEEFDGVSWASIAVLPEDPLMSAREECWVQGQVEGRDFLGLAMVVRIQTDELQQSAVDEIYIAEFPSHPELWQGGLVGEMAIGSEEVHSVSTWRIETPPGIRLRRLTHTQAARYPGVQGPRHWLMSSRCGGWVYAMRRDSRGVVRLVRVSVKDGRMEWISENCESITNAPAIDHETGRVSYLVGRRLMILDMETGEEIEIDWATEALSEIIGPVQFLKGDRGFFFSARPRGSPWLQIWTATSE